MRNRFADVIYEQGTIDERICVVVSDISPAGSIEKFRKKFPNRFINCGVAEQSMIGIASGLALEGFRPFCYTIATFALYRPFEMVRVDMCYQNLPVTVVGMGSGIIYSTLGGTHHTIEDVSIASSLPNMTVLAPCDPDEMKLATQWCAKRTKGPVYMRLGKIGEPILTKNSIEKFKFGKIRYLQKGNDVAIITYGTFMNTAVRLSKFLEDKKKKVSVISCHTLKPLDYFGIKKMLNQHDNIIVLEEHVLHGGLGMQIRNISSIEKSRSRIQHFHLKDKFIHTYGSYENLLDSHDLSYTKIIRNLKL